MRGAIGRRIAVGASPRRELHRLEEHLAHLRRHPDPNPFAHDIAPLESYADEPVERPVECAPSDDVLYEPWFRRGIRAVGVRGVYAHVEIERRRYLELKARFLELAVHRSSEALEKVLWNLPFEPYAPIRKQLLRLLKSVNDKRAAMGYEKLSPNCIRYRREIVKPFEAREGNLLKVKAA